MVGLEALGVERLPNGCRSEKRCHQRPSVPREITRMESTYDLAALDEWARLRGINDPDNFTCCFLELCKRHRLVDGKQCCNSYVAPGYSATPDDFRIAVVGMEHGSKAFETHESRRELILRAYCIADREQSSFNGHYEGVVRIAAAIFGESAKDCASGCTTICQRYKSCVINRIAQPNLVRCTPIDQTDSTSRSSSEMKHNCSLHLLEELKILRVQLVIFQGGGKGTRKIVTDTWGKVRRMKLTGLLRDGNAADDYILYHAQEESMHILFTYHGGRHRLAGQWPKVQKWIAYMREEGIIPT
jgi:hypothetical protein